jgi:hypothetical protein
MNFFKTRSKFILKNVVVNWYDEITLKFLKEKSIKFIKIKAPLDILIMYPLGIEILTKNIYHFKSTFENKVQF